MKQNMVETGRLISRGFSNGVKAAIPFVRIRSEKKGPSIAVVAAQHGRELNGIESIRQAIAALRNDLSLCGTCTFIPVANLIGCQTHKQDFPIEDARLFATAPKFNMNRGWPGRDDGELFERIEKIIWDQVVSSADICIDLHCWSSRSAMLVWGIQRDAGLIRAFGLPVHSIEDNEKAGNNLLKDACHAAGIASLTAELTPQHILSAAAVEAGKRGILNVMRQAGMLKGTLELPPLQFEFTSEHPEHTVKAPQSGLLVPRLAVNTPVKKGDLIGEIVNLNNVLKSQAVRSPADGVLFNNGPVWSGIIPESDMVTQGETVALVREATRIVNKKA